MDTNTHFQMTNAVAEKKMLPTNLLVVGPDSVLILPKLARKIYTNSNQNCSYSAVREWDFLFTILNILHKKMKVVMKTDKRNVFFQ